MKELHDLLDVVKDNEIKKGAGIGAGIGAALGAVKGDIVKTTIVGAGIGAAIAWALDQYQGDSTELTGEDSNFKTKDVDAAVETKYR